MNFGLVSSKMKFLIVASFLVVAVCALPRIPVFNSEISGPFVDMMAYMKCVSPTIDQLAMEYDCEDIWDQYRDGFLDAVDKFERSAPVFGEFDIQG